MMSVISCITNSHDLKLVLLAAALCICGIAISFKLHKRALGTSGVEAFAWIFLTAVSAGTAIWSTHFIAMLGYHPNVPVTFDPVNTVLSLLISVVGTGIGIRISSLKSSKVNPFIGGAVVGLSVAAMHFTGMFAYRVEGLVVWDGMLNAVALVLVISLAAIAFAAIARDTFGIGELLANIALCSGIICLHFVSIAAFSVIPMGETGGSINIVAAEAMALSIAVATLIIAGVGLSSYLIDSLTRQESDGQIRYLALHDHLTGLPNRTNHAASVDKALEKAAAQKLNVAVVCIDLDRFKEINDSWGHIAGDQALKIISERLQGFMGPDGDVARIGGDEFAVVKTFSDEDHLQRYLSSIEESIRQPLAIDGIEMSLESSFGVAIYPRDGDTRETLVNNADMAMYRAKSNQHQRICYYDQQLGAEVRKTRALAEDLRNAISAGQLTVYYQVQTAMDTGDILSYEALLRWTHPQLGPISPSVFIPLAEETGLIVGIGEWVLRRACEDAAKWEPGYKVAVNVSAVQLNQQDLPALVHEVLLETGLPPARLELELTETALIKDKLRSLSVIRRIKALGVKVALDDFGVGYSSLETLRVFPFDKIKLDRFFIEAIAKEPQCLAIVRAVLALGKSLDIPILAEGIETPEQWAILTSEGCDEGQGFGLGRPVPNYELASNGGPKIRIEALEAIEPLAQVLLEQALKRA